MESVERKRKNEEAKAAEEVTGVFSKAGWLAGAWHVEVCRVLRC